MSIYHKRKRELPHHGAGDREDPLVLPLEQVPTEVIYGALIKRTGLLLDIPRPAPRINPADGMSREP